MYDPELNLEVGMDAIGEHLNAKELVFTAGDQAVFEYWLATRMFDEAFKTGHLKYDPKKDDYVPGPHRNSDRFSNLPHLYESLERRIAAFYVDFRVTSEDLQTLVREMVMNAVEHGTNFCAKSHVSMCGVIGRNGQLWYVHQGAPGIDLSDRQHEELRTLKHGRFMDPASGRVRGSGLAQVHSKFHKGVRVNSHQFSDDDWGVLILQLKQKPTVVHSVNGAGVAQPVALV